MTAQLYAKVIAPKAIPGPDRLRMFELMQRVYAQERWEDFSRDLDAKTDVIVMRDSKTDTIQGFSTILMFEEVLDGKKVLALFSGDTMVDKRYWGQRVLGKAFARYILMKRLKHPFGRFYWFLISKGYKTFLLMANNVPNHFPQANRPTPAFEKRLMDQVYRRLYPKHYDPKSGLIEFPEKTCHLRAGVADISPEIIRANPRVAFFVERNPRWQAGSELACVSRMDYQCLFFYPVKSAVKIFGRRLLAALRAPLPTQRKAPTPAAWKAQG